MAFIFAPLFSGSSGNALYVERNDTCVLVDAGLPGKRIFEEMAKAGADISRLGAIFVTHEHLDHIAGVGVLMRKYHVPVYATQPTWEAMEGKIGRIHGDLVRYVNPGEEMQIGSLCVKPFAIPHDAAGPVGYVFEGGGRKLAIATDVGCMQDEWMDAVCGADMLLLESNHDVDMLRAGRYPYELKMRILGKKGHLSNDDAGIAAVKLCRGGVKQILLGHLSGENNFPELAWESVAMHLREAGVNIPLGVASRSGLSGCYDLDGAEPV